MLNLSISLEDSARRSPGKEAFIFGSNRLTYQQVNNLSNQVANALVQADIRAGDKVALSCPNLPYFPIIYYAILKVGAVVVPMSILLKKDEVVYHLTDSEAKMYFCFEGSEALPMGKEGYEGFLEVENCHRFICITAQAGGKSPFDKTISLHDFILGADVAFDSVATQAEDTAVIIYTSGTTGRPKGAELTHSNLLWNADVCRHLFQFTDEDRLLIVLPLFHIFGQSCLMNAGILHGLTCALQVRFDAVAVQNLIIEESLTIFAGVPTMYWGLLHDNSTDSEVRAEKVKHTLRRCVSGGAALPVQVLTEFEKKFNVEIFEGYGMSEGSPVVTFNQPGQIRKPGSIGTPVWGVAVKLVDEDGKEVPIGEKGELVYKGHNVMKSYYHKPEATAVTLRDGWLHSGDVAIKDKDGYFYIVDRTKDMIIRGGLNVYPREIEEIMVNHSAVSMVAVIGVPDEKFGEEIKAFVVKVPNADISEEDLIEWTKQKVAAYKYPRYIEFVASLPMNATGKILKRALRK
jgi:long-chain acyl-CoA synthetase